MNFNNDIKTLNNRKGAVLIYVIIIAAVLFILVSSATLLAVSTNNSAHNGIKSRQSYLNAKSGIEYSKVLIENKKSIIESNISANPEYVTSLPAIEYIYASGSKNGFHNDDKLNKNAEIQITCKINHEVTSSSAITEIEGQPVETINYDYNMTVNVISSADLNKSSSIWGKNNKIKLKYYIEPLKAGIIGGGNNIVGGGTKISDFLIDSNISANLTQYLSKDNMIQGEINTPYHCAVITKTLSGSNGHITADKIYFTNKSLGNINVNNDTDIQLSANYIYMSGNMNFDFTDASIGNYATIKLTPTSEKNYCYAYFDNVTFHFIKDSNELSSKQLNGIYKIPLISNGNTNLCLFEFKRLDEIAYDYNPEIPSEELIDDSMKITGTSAEKIKQKFDPYVIQKNNISLNIISGNNEGWTNKVSPSTSLWDSYSLKSSTNTFPNDLVMLYAEKMDNKNLSYSAKQIRFVTDYNNKPMKKFIIPSNKSLSFHTALLTYYGKPLSTEYKYDYSARKWKPSGSFKVISPSGNSAVPIYFERASQIGDIIYPQGYYLFPSGLNLLEDKITTIIDSRGKSRIYIDDDKSKNVIFNFKKETLYIPNTYSINIENQACATIDCPNIYFYANGNGKTGSFEFESDKNESITVYWAQDTLVTVEGKKWQKKRSFLIKSGFYNINSNSLKIENLIGDGSTAPSGVPNQGYEGIAMIGIPIDPLFIIPGSEVKKDPYFSINIPKVTMGGIYK
ncbi:hypothetical protein [Anaerovorax odorimutans]|uniref:hypothetical protein n=1 Tax=Anaerovorax odorimutans TaxID=109327 RepID=UPI00040874D8|nr:hypothetical protein [Anaerovorax odorimutans]